jgi:hypothetical protein
VRYFKLVDRVPVPCADLEEYIAATVNTEPALWHDTIGDMVVSTIFLGHGEPDQQFETMVFLVSTPLAQYRCATWDQAESQHQAALISVRDG